MRLRSLDGREVDLGTERQLRAALVDFYAATRGSSGRGEFSHLFGLRPERAMPADEASRLGEEAASFVERHGESLTAESNQLLQRLKMLADRPPPGRALTHLTTTWNDAVQQFLDDPHWTPTGDLREWFDSYTGRGEGVVEPDAIPEPFLGPLDRQPEAVFLALNPGRAFDFQGRNGLFAERIRDAGSYTAWAASWPYIDGDWEAVGQPPNPHHQARLRFLRRWLNDPVLPPAAMVAFELYPWHSTRVTGRLRPEPSLIERYVWNPISELGNPLVFAFGADWFHMLRDKLGFHVISRLGAGGKDYGSDVSSRSVLVLEGPNGLHVVAEKHSGAAGPPNADETTRMREAVEHSLRSR
jgi:hypothetical protein